LSFIRKVRGNRVSRTVIIIRYIITVTVIIYPSVGITVVIIRYVLEFDGDRVLDWM
jgi:hypothetical protein